jgi:nitroreductase
LHPLLAQRWSPRAFDPDAVLDDVALGALLEAARWAPSSMNHQPWRFVVARRGDAVHATVLERLAPANQRWARHAAALVVAVAEVERDGHHLGSARYDLGLAVAQLVLQATADGLATHQMGGFDHAGLHSDLAMPAGFVPVVVVAVGPAGDPAGLDEDLKTRERAPRHRRPLAETAFAAWGVPALPPSLAPGEQGVA